LSQAEILTAPDAVVREAGPEIARLFERHARMVLGICRALLRDGHEAEDAAQQTFLSAYRSLLGGTRPRHGGAWLAAIARNECRARIRQRMATPVFTGLDEIVAPVARDVTDAADERVQLRELRAAIADLPQGQREAVLLRDFHGLSYHELAAAMRTSSSAVESLLFRARRTVSRRVRDATECALTVPTTLREQLERAIPHFEVAQTAVGAGGGIAGIGVVGKVLALPLAAKVTAATVGVVAVGVGVGVEQQKSRAPSPLRAAAVEQAASAAAIPTRSRLDGVFLSYRPARQEVTGADADTAVVGVGSSPLTGGAGVPGLLAESAAQPEDDPIGASQSGDAPAGTPPSALPPETSVPVESTSPEASAPAPTSPGDDSGETTSTVGSSGSDAASTTSKEGTDDSGASGVDANAAEETKDAVAKSEPDDPERDVDDSDSGAAGSPLGSVGPGSESEAVDSGSEGAGSGSGSSGSSGQSPGVSSDDPPTDGNPADSAGDPANEAGDPANEAGEGSDPPRDDAETAPPADLAEDDSGNAHGRKRSEVVLALGS
jgi:RNA polymerase sigma factor (sigma-70 family)